MDDRERAALVACLLEVLAGEEETQPEARVWPRTGHPHLDSWNWHPQGPSAWRVSGRLQLHRSRRLGRH